MVVISPLMIAGASFGLDAISQVAGFGAKQQETDARNAAAMREYKFQMKLKKQRDLRESLKYRTDVSNYRAQVAENERAAQSAYAQEQRLTNDIFAQAAFRQEKSMVDLSKRTGLASAAGMRGKSANRMDSSVLADFGRNAAIRAQSLANRQDAQSIANTDIRTGLSNANRAAFTQVQTPPEFAPYAPAPMMSQGPSMSSLLFGLGTSALNSYNTYQDLQPPQTPFIGQ